MAHKQMYMQESKTSNGRGQHHSRGQHRGGFPGYSRGQHRGHLRSHRPVTDHSYPFSSTAMSVYRGGVGLPPHGWRKRALHPESEFLPTPPMQQDGDINSVFKLEARRLLEIQSLRSELEKQKMQSEMEKKEIQWSMEKESLERKLQTTRLEQENERLKTKLAATKADPEGTESYVLDDQSNSLKKRKKKKKKRKKVEEEFSPVEEVTVKKKKKKKKKKDEAEAEEELEPRPCEDKETDEPEQEQEIQPKRKKKKKKKKKKRLEEPEVEEEPDESEHEPKEESERKQKKTKKKRRKKAEVALQVGEVEEEPEESEHEPKEEPERKQKKKKKKRRKKAKPALEEAEVEEEPEESEQEPKEEPKAKRKKKKKKRRKKKPEPEPKESDDEQEKSEHELEEEPKAERKNPKQPAAIEPEDQAEEPKARRRKRKQPAVMEPEQQAYKRKKRLEKEKKPAPRTEPVSKSTKQKKRKSVVEPEPAPKAKRVKPLVLDLSSDSSDDDAPSTPEYRRKPCNLAQRRFKVWPYDSDSSSSSEYEESSKDKLLSDDKVASSSEDEENPKAEASSTEEENPKAESSSEEEEPAQIDTSSDEEEPPKPKSSSEKKESPKLESSSEEKESPKAATGRKSASSGRQSGAPEIQNRPIKEDDCFRTKQWEVYRLFCEDMENFSQPFVNTKSVLHGFGKQKRDAEEMKKLCRRECPDCVTPMNHIYTEKPVESVWDPLGDGNKMKMLEAILELHTLCESFRDVACKNNKNGRKPLEVALENLVQGLHRERGAQHANFARDLLTCKTYYERSWRFEETQRMQFLVRARREKLSLDLTPYFPDRTQRTVARKLNQLFPSKAYLAKKAQQASAPKRKKRKTPAKRKRKTPAKKKTVRPKPPTQVKKEPGLPWQSPFYGSDKATDVDELRNRWRATAAEARPKHVKPPTIHQLERESRNQALQRNPFWIGNLAEGEMRRKLWSGMDSVGGRAPSPNWFSI